ncbi:siderophore-interacting protein [Falsarthrobacter nasiphocae]|uniref:NADPH-dependent ferric siderophore reductase n=1 Tax=Falsarthrobacter nasiphocae TaxID=189863 RepID=A0AAE4C667_9MICC|nr:siderophore-interacting protein [Falsarthrobacter nasiphocae]MDR6892253.1 NADPH-dependent ferric siderophore reductase [Falsarthrobacter nasiphocae]
MPETATETPSEPALLRCVRGAVTEIRRVSPGFARVTLASEGFTLMGDGGPYLDCRIKIIFGGSEGARLAEGPIRGSRWYSQWREQAPEERGAMRTFSIVAARPGEIDVEFALHAPHEGRGPAAEWIDSAAVGDELDVIGPELAYWSRSGARNHAIEFAPGEAGRIVIVGDATALPAIESILRDWDAAARPGAEARVLVEIPHEADRRPLEREGVEVEWVVSGETLGARLVEEVWGARGAAHARFLAGEPLPALPVVLPASPPADTAGDDDADAAEGLLWEAGDAAEGASTYVWVAGEQGAVRDVRRFYVQECGIDRRSVAFMGYWKRGQAQAS